MKNTNFSEVLESYNINEDPDLIAIESYIYAAFESDAAEVKTNLRKLAKAKAENDDAAVREAKKDVDDSIREINNNANNEKDARKKEKLKKAAKLAGVIAGTLATAATINVAVKKIRDKSIAKQTIDTLVKQYKEFEGEKPSKETLRDYVNDNLETLRGTPGQSDRKVNNAIKLFNKIINKMDLAETDDED